MYLILHGFSRRNSGDGLLVDLTLEALEAAGVERDQCHLLALDPDSFADLDHVHCAPGEPAAQMSWRLAKAAGELASDFLFGSDVEMLARKARGMIAVGGGYLVTDSLTRQAGVLLNHMVQMRVASRAQVPTIYLPQSVGPLHGPVGAMTRNLIAGIDRFYLRDDISMRELPGPNFRRCPDLAVMKLARELPRSVDAEGTASSTILVGRALPDDGDYVQRLETLSAKVDQPIWAVQADMTGPRSDRSFYREQGWTDGGSLSQVIEQNPSSVVVSVRLHGAIASLIAGRPAIHLSYERKGWGAYEDLGISEFVHDARCFDPDLVAAQTRELQISPGRFWDAIAAAVPRLKSHYDDMVADLRARLITA
ncbi:MAG: polysaccharide pyruvyl transferase family protein [Sphingomonadaceae bacterium]|nr:polysaccharide pyruvyl transferase family protein [Sphingomonadaceae bacterium]